MLAATMVKPPMIAECKVKLEASVVEVKPLGYAAGVGNLVICELLRKHMDDSVLSEVQQIDPFALDLVARLGQNWYCKTGSMSLFELEKPAGRPIGVDLLPQTLKSSPAFTAEHLAQLAHTMTLPTKSISLDPYVQKQAAALLDKGMINHAWELLLSGKNLV